jgi:hypothetical protein
MNFSPNGLFFEMARIMSDNYFNAPKKVCIRIRNEGGSRCFAGSQEINTINGPVPISQLNVGDMVLTLNEAANRAEYKRVDRLHQFKNDKRAVRLKMKGGSIIECTEDHEFYHEGSWYSLKHLLSLKEKRK